MTEAETNFGDVADTQPAPNTMLAAVEGGMISCERDVEVFARSRERP